MYMEGGRRARNRHNRAGSFPAALPYAPQARLPLGTIRTMYSWSPGWERRRDEVAGRRPVSGHSLLLHFAHCVLCTRYFALRTVVSRRHFCAASLNRGSLAGAAPDRRALALSCESAGTKFSKNDRARLQAREGNYPYLWIHVKGRRRFFSSPPRRQARRARPNCLGGKGLRRPGKRGKSRKIIAEIFARSRPRQERQLRNRRNLLARRHLRIPVPRPGCSAFHLLGSCSHQARSSSVILPTIFGTRTTQLLSLLNIVCVVCRFASSPHV